MTLRDSLLAAIGRDLADGLDDEAIENNAEIRIADEYNLNPPSRRWVCAPFDHPSVARALRIDPTEYGASFALSAFRPMKIDEEWRICAAWPTPRTIGVLDDDWLDIEHILAWDPKTNACEILGDPQPQLFGRWDGYYAPAKTGRIYGQPRAFLQAWAIDRARFYAFAHHLADKKWQSVPDEPDLVPGFLIVGDLGEVRWNVRTEEGGFFPYVDVPEMIECIGADAKQVNRSILRAARLPRVVDATMKAAA